MTNANGDLPSIAREIRRHIVKMIAQAGSGHPGGSLSCTDILTALYFKLMNIDPDNPDMPGRDRLVLSKGHAAPALYATLAVRGYFPVEELKTLRQINSRLQGHPDMTKTPGVEASTGSLGQGLSFANGLALTGKLDGSDYTVYCLIGDGEIEEGQIWEAAMTAAHYKLDNLIAILDNNGLQIDGPTREVMASDPKTEKFRAFGFEVIEIDGHSFEEITAAVEKAKSVKGRPTMIIAHTVKGKGVSFMEDQVGWHGKAPNDEQLEQALRDLS